MYTGSITCFPNFLQISVVGVACAARSFFMNNLKHPIWLLVQEESEDNMLIIVASITEFLRIREDQIAWARSDEEFERILAKHHKTLRAICLYEGAPEKIGPHVNVRFVKFRGTAIGALLQEYCPDIAKDHH